MIGPRPSIAMASASSAWRTPKCRTANAGWWSVQSVPKASLLLAEASNDAQRAAIGNQTGGRVGFFLKTDDFARDQARFVKAGVVFQEAPRQEVYGTVAVFHDLYGNLWDLIEPAPADPSVSAKVTA